MKNALVSQISRRTVIADGRPILVIELTNGQTIIREEFQAEIDASNSQMTVDELIRDVSNGGTVVGDFTFNEAGTSYVVDENSSLVKNGVLNEATGEAYKVGDTAVRKQSGMRVEGFLQFTKNEDADLNDRIAAQYAKQLMQKRATRFSNARIAATAPGGDEDKPAEIAAPATTDAPAVEEIPAGEEIPATTPAPAVEETPAE